MRETIQRPEFGEQMVRERLDSGLSVVVVPKTGLQKTFATYATHYGSIDSHFRVPGGGEVRVPDGIAHFLEHKMFEKPEGDAFERYARAGAYANAYTDNSSTTFLFSSTEQLDENLRTLVDVVERPHFTEANVEKEKGIIEQEIRMYLDMPGDRLRSNLMHALYQKHPVRIDIAGTVESIRQITPDDLYTCYKTFYHPSNMVMFIVGDVEPEAVLENLRNRESGRDLAQQGEIVRIFPTEPDLVSEPRREQKRPVAAPLFLMGYKDIEVGLTGKDLLRREMVFGLMWNMILGRSSGLFQELYQMGLVNDRFSAHYTGAPTYGYSSLGGETPDPERLEALLLERISRAALTEEDLNRQKKRELGEFIGLLDSMEDFAYVFNALHFRDTDIWSIPLLLADIRVEDIEAARDQHLHEAQRAVSIIRPLS